MSIKVMSLVWDNFPRGGSDMLVMLAMADWCNDEGASLHPSHAAVAKKCRMSRVQAQRIVKSLVSDGWLDVIANPFGGSPGTTKKYRLNVEKLRSADGYQDDTCISNDTGITGDTGITQVRDGYHLGASTGITGDTQTTIEPPIEPPITPLPPETVDSKFLAFWNAYPKKVGKEAARKVWMKLKSPAAALDAILIALAWQVSSDQWRKNNGQYIPNPATYLTQQRWLDEQPVAMHPRMTAVGQASANAASRWLDAQGFQQEKAV